MDAARDALIVAIADYRDPKLQRLRSPAADAEALARVLADTSIGGFRVELAADEDESTLSRRLARFFSNRRPDDLLLVHFSCHGIKDASGELYMAAADTETDLLSATGIPSRWLNEQIGQCRSKRIVVLLDCCFSGSFPFGVHARAGEQVVVQEHLIGRGRVVITASNAMEYSFEGDELSGAGEPSFFTAAVVEGLETGKADRDGDRLVSVDELYDYVYDRVRERTLNQSPTKLSSLEGPLYVARSRYEAPVEPAALPQDLMDLIQHPYSGARLSAVEELSTLLSSRNRGLALAGRLSLEQLARDDSRKVSDRVREVLLHHASVNELEEVEPPAGVVAPEPTAPPEKNAALATTEPEAALATIEPEPLRPPAAQALSQTEHETLAGAHTAGAVAIAGAAAVLVSLLGDSNPQQHFAGYWVPVAVMAAGVIALIAYALRSKRSEILLAGAGLAFALLGVTFPLGWVYKTHPAFPGDFWFWLGACGAAGAAVAAGVAVARQYPNAPRADGAAPRPMQSRGGSLLLAFAGLVIVVVSVFVLNEWSQGMGKQSTWKNWPGGIHRYPSALMLVCLVVAALAVAGIYSNRRRLLLAATAVACFLVAEAVPLFLTSSPNWGPGRWVRIAGAVIALVGLALVTFRPAEHTRSWTARV